MTSFQEMSSLAKLSPVADKGGLGKFWQLFSDEAESLIEELNLELAA